MLFENQNNIYYIGLDLHKKKIAYCVKKADGSVVRSGEIAATKASLDSWRKTLDFKWSAAMEATIFTGWVYDSLKPYAHELRVVNPLVFKAISASKKKNDQLDASKIADAIRCDLIDGVYMAPVKIREMRKCLRQRNFMVQVATKIKNNTTAMMMMCGFEYTKRKFFGRKYFKNLMDTAKSTNELPDSVINMAVLNKGALDMINSIQKNIIKDLKNNILLMRRIELLQTIPGVGEILSLVWALEIGEPDRFSNIKKAISYCGLCAGQNESAGKSKRGPISKQRNKHLQWVLVEAAKFAAFKYPHLNDVYNKAIEKGNHNSATLAVARKLVAHLLAVDKAQKEFTLGVKA